MGLHFCLALLMLTVSDAMEGPPSTDRISDSTEPPSPSDEMPQAIQCSQKDFCPEYGSRERWDNFTAKCCPAGDKNSGLTLHAQRRKRQRCILACLPATMCKPGHIPILHERYVDKRRYAFITCEACPENNKFEPTPLESYKYRLNPKCRYTHQNCNPARKALVRAGNSTHDATCRCLWEKGFAPFPNTSACASREGFDGNTVCACERRRYCQEGMDLNHEYKCVPTPPSTKMSTKADQGVETTEAISPKPTVEKDDDDAGEPDSNGPEGWKWYLAALVTCFLAAAVFISSNFHP